MKNPIGFAKILIGIGAVLWMIPFAIIIAVMTCYTTQDLRINALLTLWAFSAGIILMPLGLALFLGGFGIMTLRSRKSLFSS